MALITGREVKKGPKQIPYNQQLWNMLVTQAKSRFNKYPSPAAAHWVHSRYVQMGGKFVTSERDVPSTMRDYAAEAAKEKAKVILGMDIKGHTVHRVMIAQAAPIESEYYVSILLDRSNRSFLVMASVAGGMDIEEVARTAPEKLAKIPVSAVNGIDNKKAAEIVSAANFPADVANDVAKVLEKL